MRGWLSSLAKDRRGGVSILMAGGMIMLLASAALGVDTASYFLEKRRLQGVADAAAIAAADTPYAATSAAQRAIDVNRPAVTRLVQAEGGSYDRDAGSSIDERFVTGSAVANAARVTVEGQVDTIFGRALGVGPRIPIRASATAARVDTAAISIGSRLASLDGGIANALLSGLTGSDLQLSVMDYNSLAGAQTELLQTLTGLRTRIGFDVATFGNVLAADVQIADVVTAMAGATSDLGAAAALRALANRLPDRKVKLGDLIDLGLLDDASAPDPARPIRVGTLALLREAVIVGGAARQMKLDLSPGIPGLLRTRYRIEIGERPNSSPWLSVGRAGEVTVRTAQARVQLDTTLASIPLGLGAIELPIVVEAASAEATLTRIDCSRATGPAATLSATPSIGTLAIADIDDRKFGDFTTALTLRPATILRVPLVSVKAYAAVKLGGATAQTVAFSAADVANHTAKTVRTTDLTSGIAASLVRDVRLDVSVLGLFLPVGPIVSAVGSVLALAAPALDTLIAGTTALLGVGLGEADLWVDGVRCGAPVLVA